MEWWHVYLFTRLDGINAGMAFLAVAGAVGVIGYFIFARCWCGDSTSLAQDREMQTQLLAKLPKYCIAPVVVVFIWVMIPTQKEAAAIYLLPKLAHSDFAKEAQQLPTVAAKLMRLKLEAWISDMEPKKAEKK